MPAGRADASRELIRVEGFAAARGRRAVPVTVWLATADVGIISACLTASTAAVVLVYDSLDPSI